MPWLVWRQHRTTFAVLLAVAVVVVAALLWLRGQLADALAVVATGDESPAAQRAVETSVARLQPAGLLLACFPLLTGVFVGAPLFAGDLENATAKLVGVQTRSRFQWVAAKLGMAALVTVLMALSTGLTMKSLWMVGHAHAQAPRFTDAVIFDTTGPVAVALALCGLLLGATAGLLLGRTLPAMVTTFGAMVALAITWSLVRPMFGTTTIVTTSGGHVNEADRPPLPVGSIEVDTSYIASNGSLHGWGACTDVADRVACLRNKGIVGWSMEYLPLSQLGPMQWAATGALSLLIVLVAALTVHAARRTLR
ncbi:ABC transporter permease (plasmid) [Streptomyces tendae]|uniref:ABC transporter permease n=1 Tax=Streptomyces tendae TaxID=1932 RepID=A0ABX6A0V3_STRTE|nr:ABC transporter permease [Streptomyces tendae]